MTSVHEKRGIPASTGERGGDEHARDAARAETPPGSTPTAAQLRRFIKSRPYVPLHELRRRFELNAEMDQVTAVRTLDGLTVYVGLPERESQLIGDLARDGDIGLELGRDPRVPIVVGVYPIRPVGRG